MASAKVTARSTTNTLTPGASSSQLEELRERLYRYMSDRYESLFTDCDTQAAKTVYLLDSTQGNDPHMDVVFTDKTALQSVRFRHFMQDCRAIAAERCVLDSLMAQERQAVLTYLHHTYQNILATFDPKIVKFRKKYKVVIADGAFKGLL